VGAHDFEAPVAALRIIDANANRASEGLRVVEEFARFNLDDRFLTGLCKQLRHDLTAALAELPAYDLTTSRDTARDVGTEITLQDEKCRRDSRDVAAASQKRVEQSLRCIEEYAKTFAPHLAAAVEQLRYRAYTLAKAIATTRHSRERLAAARLYVLLDGQDSEESLERVGCELVQAGVDVIQLRDKQLSDRELIGRARRLRRVTRSSNTIFIVNDRPDLAALADADGVHVGQDELSVHDARAIMGTGKLVGVSTHSIDQARQAVLDGANYLGCGPTFPSTTKQFAEFPGTAFLQEVAREISLPAFAIGGINLGNVKQVVTAGVVRVAVGAGLVNAEDVSARVKEFRAALDRGTHPVNATITS